MAHIQKRERKDRHGKKVTLWVARYRVDGEELSQVFPLQREAQEFLVDQESQKRQGKWVNPKAGKVSLESFARDWFEEAAYLARTTRAAYASLLRTHIYPALGSRALNGIRASDLRTFVASLTAKGLHPKTVGNAYRLLVEVLRVAKDDNLIGEVPLPRPERGERRRGVLPPVPKPEHHFKTAAEIALLANTEPIAPRYTALVFLGCYGALRWGEIAGLRVPRLKLLERKVEITETNEGEPKWGSAGTVHIPAEIAEELARHLTEFPPGPDGFVFGSPNGHPLAYHNFRRHWDRAVERAGLGPMTPHDLRHSGVALAIAAGGHPREIQELCRHTSFAMTMNVYGGLFTALHERLAGQLGETFRRVSQSHAGQMRDGGGTKVVQMPTRDAETGS
jgi:integrase